MRGRISFLPLLLLSAVLVLMCASLPALAASPDGLVEATTTIDQYGDSRWTYQDAYDTWPNRPKREGAYTINGDGYLQCFNCHNIWNLSEFEGKGPHGGYDTTTNKCKMCHAVHRAQGAYYLLRADTQDDACAYCHLDGAIFSRIIVYDLNPGGIYTPNGHTIGASSIIPDSSVKQWLEDVALKTFDADGNEVTETVEVRRYYERRNKMFRFGKHHGQDAAADAPFSKYSRIGPLALRCMNCHQPHNAIELIWMPPAYPTTPGAFNSSITTGYKLLRASPSGSISGTSTFTVSPFKTADDAMLERLGVTASSNDGVAPQAIVRVPESTLTTANTGYPYTIWTRWPGTEADSDPAHAVDRNPSHVNQLTLSVWCADCHNLNIGYWEETSAEFGGKLHGERTHPAPYTGAYNGPAQCYSCHRNDMPLKSGGYDEYGLTYTKKYLYNSAMDSCEQCHFGTASYYDVKTQANEKVYERFPWAWLAIDLRYDFPHSGGAGNESYPSYIKMLGPWTAYIDESGAMQTTVTTISSTNLDAVCKRCHPGIGVRH